MELESIYQVWCPFMKQLLRYDLTSCLAALIDYKRQFRKSKSQQISFVRPVKIFNKFQYATNLVNISCSAFPQYLISHSITRHKNLFLAHRPQHLLAKTYFCLLQCLVFGACLVLIKGWLRYDSTSADFDWM